jgi:hypothetical protein
VTIVRKLDEIDIRLVGCRPPSGLPTTEVASRMPAVAGPVRLAVLPHGDGDRCDQRGQLGVTTLLLGRPGTAPD